MPVDLNIVVLKPIEADDTDSADRHARQLQFTKEFTVRKDVVLAWLRFLKANHPGYRDVSIDHHVDLPHNGNVMDQVANGQYKAGAAGGRDTTGDQRLRTQPEANPANSAEEENEPDDEGFDSGAIPAMNADRNLDDLRRRVGAAPVDGAPLGGRQPQQRPALTWPDVEERLLTEWLDTQPILSLAFPSLYPRGLGEIKQSRDRHVSYRDHAIHLMKYKDGRFAQHPRWRYVVFNTEMRMQTKNSARFFLKLNP